MTGISSIDDVEVANDHFLIEVLGEYENPLGLAGGQRVEDGVKEGIVVKLGDRPAFFGFNTFFFDSSLMNEEVLKKVTEHYKYYLGRKVWWPKLSESGTDVKIGDKDYVCVKYTAIMLASKESYDV